MLISFEMERYALLVFPSCSIGIECSAGGFVGNGVTRSFVHWVVNKQLFLVAGESVHVSECNLLLVESFGPKTNFHDISVEALAE